MSPRQFGKVDQSTGWPNLPCCPHQHMASAPCPPTGAWLVLVLCGRCRPPEQYCGKHGGRRQLEPVPYVPDTDQQSEVAARYDREEG
jgi:hypothetical protein